MKNIKHYGKRWLAMVLSLVMCFGLLQTTSLAANWNPGDKITINVRVYDQSTGAVYNVGTDSVTKGDQYIQSVTYQIPQLTKFVSASQFGRVIKVVGNWYFPAGDSQPGANVEWSCNANSVTMTYWVTSYSTGSGSGTGSNQNENVNIGSSGNYSWTQYIRYHSNYPDGTDYTYTVAYNIRSYTNMYNTFGNVIKTLAEAGFSTPNGYSAKSPIWNTAKNGTGTGYAASSNYVFYQSNQNQTLDLYAQWQPAGGTPVETVTLTFMNGNTVYGTQDYFVGEIATAVLCSADNPGYTFKGWDTLATATNVVYLAGETFEMTKNTTLYAVWDANLPATTTLTISKELVGLDADQLPADFKVTASIQAGSETKSVTLNKDKLSDTVTINTSTTYSVMLGESNYDVEDYACTVSGGAGAMGSGATWFYTIAAGTLNPTCSLTNTYVSTIVPTKHLDSISKDRLLTVPDGVVVENLNTDEKVSLKNGAETTLLYAITVVGDVGANYEVTDEGTTYVGGDALKGSIGDSGKAVIYVTKTISIDDVVEGYVENVAYVKAGADTAPIPGTDPGKATPSDPALTQVTGELVGVKTYEDWEDGTLDFTVEVTNKVGSTLSAIRLTDTMNKVSMIMDANGKPSYTVKLYTDGVESTPNVSRLTSDGTTTVWVIDGPIAPDAKIVVTYSGKLDDGLTAAGGEWENAIAATFRRNLNSVYSLHGEDQSVDVWEGMIEFSCRGVVEK